MIARLRAVLDQSFPRLAGLDRRPQIDERFHGHVRVAHDIVRRTDQFLLGEAADVDKLLVGKCNYPARIRTRNQKVTIAKFDFLIRNWAYLLRTQASDIHDRL